MELLGETVRLRARVETLSGLSAHADQEELVKWLEAVPGKKRIALHHGEPQVQEALAAFLAE